MKALLLTTILVKLSLSVDVVYPESEPASVVTAASAEDLRDIKAPGDEDEVSHFVEVSEEKKRPFVGRTSRGSASTDFQARIKQRLQKEKNKLALKELAAKSTSVSSATENVRAARFNSGFSRDRSRSRYSSKARDSLYSKKSTSASSDSDSSNKRFTPSRSSYSVRNRFSSLISNRRDTPKPTTIIKPQVSTNKGRYGSSYGSTFSSDNPSTDEDKNINVPEIKKFDRFQRPDYKKDFLKKYYPKPKDKLLASSHADHDGDDTLHIFPSVVDDDYSLQDIGNDVAMERLMTTLHVSSMYPQDMDEEYLEIATIRSPYTFDIEENEKSTRFITITKSMTKSLDISPSHSFTSPPSASSSVASIRPSSVAKPLFDTNSIPAPENILASTSLPRDSEPLLQGSSDIEYLAPLTLTASLHQATPPLKTVTETLSTMETMTKRSILPVIFGEDESSLLTLTQTYSVTRIVTAVKTVPPMELYEFNPQQNFADFDALFEEAGSERRESLLPGELEFSDQDDFGLEGPNVVKVAPPSDFVKDLDLVGSKFDFVDQMEKHNNPDLVQLKPSSPSLESSQGSPLFSSSPARPQATPSLPDQGLAALGITPEQLLYLQLLQNPLAALGIGGAFQQPQVITETTPVYKTEPVIDTSVIKLTFGAKEIFTTITETHGVTTRTDYITATKTVNGGGLGGVTAALGGLGQLGGGQISPEQAPGFGGLGLGGLVPSFTVISSPVTRDTVVTETLTEEFKINFRNQEIYTTITSTSLVTTQITSFITKTQRVLPTANPLAGLLG